LKTAGKTLAGSLLSSGRRKRSKGREGEAGHLCPARALGLKLYPFKRRGVGKREKRTSLLEEGSGWGMDLLLGVKGKRKGTRCRRYGHRRGKGVSLDHFFVQGK